METLKSSSRRHYKEMLESTAQCSSNFLASECLITESTECFPCSLFLHPRTLLTSLARGKVKCAVAQGHPNKHSKESLENRRQDISTLC